MPSLHELAHDLSQPLTVIEATAYCLEMLLPAEDPAISAHLERIRRQVELASQILTSAQADERAANRSRAMAGAAH
jgi:signal transduction histidine kinase